MRRVCVSRFFPMAFAFLALAIALPGRLSAQYTTTILYTYPYNTFLSAPSAVVMDGAGRLYGTTVGQGSCGNLELCGTVFELSPSSSGWTQTTIYSSNIAWGNLGAPLVMDASGNLYGVIGAGGNASAKYCSEGCGSVFQLTPTSGGWQFSTLFSFHGSDGGDPYLGLTLDAAGSLYGTTSQGGIYNCGTVFKLTLTSSGWQHKALHFFTCGNDGKLPSSPLTLDAAGNIYGTAGAGGTDNFGTVFRLTPNTSGVTISSRSTPSPAASSASTLPALWSSMLPAISLAQRSQGAVRKRTAIRARPDAASPTKSKRPPPAMS